MESSWLRGHWAPPKISRNVPQITRAGDKVHEAELRIREQPCDVIAAMNTESSKTVTVLDFLASAVAPTANVVYSNNFPPLQTTLLSDWPDLVQ